VLGYSIGKWALTWQSTYIGSSDIDDQFLAGFGAPRGALDVDSYVSSDVQFRFSQGSYELFLGANNVFNEQPPPLITGLNENVTGTETDAGTYDAIGRRLYGGFRMKF
jgi:outer membrane receptor protein involved in Fe transport